MLENRSFDHMLGYLYADDKNVAPSGQPFEGLTGTESNPDASGNPERVPPDNTAGEFGFDFTRFGVRVPTVLISPLTARDGAAPGFGDVLTLATPRTDDVLAGVVIPIASGPNPAAAQPSHLQEVQADLISLAGSGPGSTTTRTLAHTATNAAYAIYIRHHSVTRT